MTFNRSDFISSFESYIGRTNLLKQVWAIINCDKFFLIDSIPNLHDFPFELCNPLNYLYINPSGGTLLDPVVK